MTGDSTLGGYMDVHDRPPAFEGSDGRAYTAAVFVDESAAADGRFGASLLFVQWSEAGDHPIGHLETPYLAFGDTPGQADAAIRCLTLHDVKRYLDQAIVEARASSG